MGAFLDLASDTSSYSSIAEITTNTTTTWGLPIDTSKFDGVSFFAAICEYTDGNYSMLVEESDDGATYSEVPSDILVLGRFGLTLPEPAFGVCIHANVGIFGCKRYLRFSIVSTNVTTGAVCLLGATASGTIDPYALAP